jgi:hypothetical protein
LQSSVCGRVKDEGRAFGTGLVNVEIGDWSDDFAFIIGDHRYQCPSYVAPFLLPRVSELHWIDATISELSRKGRHPDKLFRSVLNGAEAIALQSTRLADQYLRRFTLLCGIQSVMNRFVFM